MLDLLHSISPMATLAAMTGLRVSIGAFFAISGYHKLFNKERHAHLVAGLTADHIPAVWFNQYWVPAVELSAGLGVAFGFLTPLSAAGLFVISLVATLTDGLGRIPAWHPIDRADYVDDVLYLPEVLYAVILLVFIAAGGGNIALDAIIWR